MDFVAIDFETANPSRGSACAVGLAKVRDGQIVDTRSYLINPEEQFSPYNIAIHGISNDMVAGAPSFPTVLGDLIAFADDLPFVAHNIQFDSSVMERSCAKYGLQMPNITMVCSLAASRHLLPGLGNYRLETVCDCVGVELTRHHSALDDAIACAEVMLRLAWMAQADSIIALYNQLGLSVWAASSVSNAIPRMTASRSAGANMRSVEQNRKKAIATLAGIVQGMIFDHRIPEREHMGLLVWLKENESLLAKPPYSHLRDLMDNVLPVQIITEDEGHDILLMCESLLNESGYEDNATRDIHTLHGLLQGILSDGELSASEVNGLRTWLNDTTHLAGYFPYDEIRGTVEMALADGELDALEIQQLKRIFSDFDVKNSDPAPCEDTAQKSQESKVITCVFDADPEIIFDGRLFCVTGDSLRATRNEMARLIERAGGLFKNNVLRSTDYLIVGTNGSPSWAFDKYGRKVEQAIKLRKDGVPIRIVCEDDFWAALDAMTAAS